MPHVRKLIADYPDSWLDKIRDDYKIPVVQCKDNPHLVSLKYDQISADFTLPIVQECRGMVVNLINNKIMAMPYFKFHNYGDSLANTVDWSTARVQDKVDGSLITLWFDPDIDDWRVASSGHPTAGGTVWPGTQLFRELFWQTFASLNMRVPEDVDHRNSCFMFELCTESNRVVCKVDKPRIVCHGARRLHSESELDRKYLEFICQMYNWECVKEYPLQTVEDVLKAAEALNPVENEGFVVVDAKFNRVKIKSPRYVALHHCKSGLSTEKNIARLILSGESEEMLTYFPELEGDFIKQKAKLDGVLEELKAAYEQHRHIESQKDFALAIVGKVPMTGVLFNTRKNKCEVADTWKQSTDVIIRHLYE